MTRIQLAAAMAAFAPMGALADDLLDALALADWPEPAACSETLRIVSDEEDGPVTRAFRIDAGEETVTMIEGPQEEILAYEQKKAEVAEAADAAEPDGENEADDDEEGVSVGATPYGKAAATEGFGYVRQDDQDGLAVYRAEDLPDGTFEMNGRDFSGRSVATLYVDAAGDVPVVARRTVELVKPMRIPLIAKVRALSIDDRYAVIGGAPRPVAMTMTFDADVMGKEQAGQVAMTRTDHDCAVPAAEEATD